MKKQPQKKAWTLGISFLFLLGVIYLIAHNTHSNKIPDFSYSLEGVIDEGKSTPFACHFGHFTVEMVNSRYTDYKYFKLQGSGVLVNSLTLSSNVDSHPKVIYAVPKDSPIQNGSILSVCCISRKNVPYEGEERKEIDQEAALMEFYLLNN